MSQLEDQDNGTTHTVNGHNNNIHGAIGIGIGIGGGGGGGGGGVGNGHGNGTERDKNHMEERKNSFLSQSYSINSNNTQAHHTHKGGVDGLAMKSFNIQPSVTTPLTAKRNQSPSSSQQIKSYGSAK